MKVIELLPNGAFFPKAYSDFGILEADFFIRRGKLYEENTFIILTPGIRYGTKS